MDKNIQITKLKETIQTASQLLKCRKCACMKESLETIKNQLSKNGSNDFFDLQNLVKESIRLMEPSEYT